MSAMTSAQELGDHGGCMRTVAIANRHTTDGISGVFGVPGSALRVDMEMRRLLECPAYGRTECIGGEDTGG
jgi:hypothetical protein